MSDNGDFLDFFLKLLNVLCLVDDLKLLCFESLGLESRCFVDRLYVCSSILLRIFCNKDKNINL